MYREALAKLEVHEARFADIYKDVARIHSSKRDGIQPGSVCELSANGRKRWVVVRGLMKASEENWIRLDEVTRNKLALEFGDICEFRIAEVGWFKRVCWAVSASDPGSRIAAQLGAWSIILGIISVVLGLASCVPKAP